MMKTATKKAKKKASRSRTFDDNIAIFVLICFFFSGVTSLIYEVLWTRMIVKIIGGAPFAVSIILTVFMGGLGLGSLVAAWTIDRIKEPMKLVKIYGILELAVGVYALSIPMLLAAFRPLYAILYNRLFGQFILYNLLTFLGCSILLCIPVICMGATLPILCRFYVTKLSHLGTRAGRLYGVNTIGAALGAFLCGFWLINLMGMWGTLIFAVLINGLIGLSCIIVGYKSRSLVLHLEPIQADCPKAPSEDAGQEIEPAQGRTVVVAALLIFAVSGFCAMSYEVIWTKLLGLLVGPTTYSFTIVIVTFILGLALGSMIFGRLADRTNKIVWLLVYTQVAAGLFALGVSQILGNSQLFFAKLIFSFAGQFGLLSASKVVILFCFMIFPTICLGATFPLIGKIYTESISKVGRSIGFAYTINTIGAVAGSFCGGFVLIPLLGKERGLSLTIGIQLFGALVMALVLLWKEKRELVKRVCLLLPALAGVILCFYFPSWNRFLLSKGRYHRFEDVGVLKGYGWLTSLFRGPEILSRFDYGELVYYGDGIGGFTTVLKHAHPLGNFVYLMANSGKMDASSRGDMGTQTLLANFPMLFHQDPKTVMVLGLASGITAGEVLNYPVEQLDVIDINRQVVAASNFFLPWNNNVLSNPKTHLIIQDARAHLLLTKQKYDVIISEPSNPWMAGLATLFTRDFFAMAKDRLNNDGMFVQFMHSYQMDWSTFALVGRTFAEVFPNSLLISTESAYLTSDFLDSPSDFLFVGFKGKNGLMLENARQRIKYTQQSKNVALSGPELLYRLIVSEDLGKLFGPGPINTDNWPKLEFAAPKLMFRTDPAIPVNIYSKEQLGPETKDIVQHVTTNVDSQIDFAVYCFSLYLPFRDENVDLARATPLQKERFFKLMESYSASNPIDYSILTNSELKQRCRAIQIETICNNIDRMSEKAISYDYLANLYYAENKLEEAADKFSKSLRLWPANAEAHHTLADIFIKQGKLDAAISHCRQGLEIKPGSAKLHCNLGIVLASQGKINEAIRHYRQAIRLKPDWTVPLNNLANILVTNPNPNIRNARQAIKLAKRAAELTKYRDVTVLITLTLAYAAEGQFEQASATAQTALALASAAGDKNSVSYLSKQLEAYRRLIR